MFFSLSFKSSRVFTFEELPSDSCGNFRSSTDSYNSISVSDFSEPLTPTFHQLLDLNLLL